MNKIFVITGGTSGIGKQLVKEYSKLNKVFVLSKDEKKINKMQNELNSNNVIFIKCDLNDKNDIENSFRYIGQETDHIDVLINNAAYDSMCDIEKYDYDIFSKIISTNLIGKVFCIKSSICLLKKSKYPVIINIASRLAIKPMKNSSAYCCAASGIVMLTKCAALELEKYSIRVNCISPSLIKTPLSLKSYTTKTIEKTKNISTRKRLCEINDIYNTIEFLISKKSDFINGENINVSGGILLK